MISVDFLCYREAFFLIWKQGIEPCLRNEQGREERKKNVNMVYGKYLRQDLPNVIFCVPNPFELNKKGYLLEYLFTFLLFLFFKAFCLQYFILYPVPSFLLHL